MMGKPRKPRSDAKMYQLPKDILQGVNERLVNCNMSCADICAWLAEKGYKVSQASLSRYAFKVFEAAQRIADDLEKTKAVVDFIGRNPDLDTTEATSAILKSGLLQKISSAEEEFNDMPIEKAGRLFVQLSKAEADRMRTAAVKRKAELAFDQMEAGLLKAIKQHPELSEELHSILQRARKRVLDEDGNLDASS